MMDVMNYATFCADGARLHTSLMHQDKRKRKAALTDHVVPRVLVVEQMKTLLDPDTWYSYDDISAMVDSPVTMVGTYCSAMRKAGQGEIRYVEAVEGGKYRRFARFKIAPGLCEPEARRGFHAEALAQCLGGYTYHKESQCI